MTDPTFLSTRHLNVTYFLMGDEWFVRPIHSNLRRSSSLAHRKISIQNLSLQIWRAQYDHNQHISSFHFLAWPRYSFRKLHLGTRQELPSHFNRWIWIVCGQTGMAQEFEIAFGTLLYSKSTDICQMVFQQLLKLYHYLFWMHEFYHLRYNLGGV